MTDKFRVFHKSAVMHCSASGEKIPSVNEVVYNARYCINLGCLRQVFQVFECYICQH
ncbi:hypothetical protein RhiirA5_505310 [Rhizophagus irregularis]|uniref:Uncharacterized protein n=1 Tax=Rhizophagus irregularis TaxID=588596 RepID=A0A2N0P075_9GLOM|nr:hypothetical protein RhiirA5_505310 [Rhizophagus irregularis]